MIYDGRCRRLSPQEREELAGTRRPAWRVEVPEETASFVDRIQGPFSQNLAREWGTLYPPPVGRGVCHQLAVVVDDAAMGSPRWCGERPAGLHPRQLWLQEELGLPHPEYGHVPLLLAPDGRRLAKRNRDQELGALQNQYTAPELVGRLAHLAGLIPEPAPVTPAELVPLFSWEKLPKEDRTAPR